VDINLKLLALNDLYYCDEEIKAQIDSINAEGFEELVYGDNPKYGWFSCIPEVRERLVAIEISDIQLEKITILSSEACKVHFMIMPNWDGEGDEFKIVSFSGIERMINLKSIQYVDFDKVIDLSNLLRIKLDEIKEHSGLSNDFISRLRSHGVRVS
jgi:hypothetical protein